MPVWSVPGNHENFGIERHLSLVTVMTGPIVFVAVACAALEELTCNCQLLDHEHSAGSADRACTNEIPVRTLWLTGNPTVGGGNRRGVVGTGLPGAIGRAQCKKGSVGRLQDVLPTHLIETKPFRKIECSLAYSPGGLESARRGKALAHGCTCGSNMGRWRDCCSSSGPHTRIEAG